MPTDGNTFGAKSTRFCATLKLPVAAPDSTPEVAAVAVLVPLYSQDTVSDPGCTAVPAGGLKTRLCVAFNVIEGCCVSCVGTFQLRTSELPTSGNAPNVTTKAPVFRLNVPAP